MGHREVDLSGRIALVTGASRGIGSATARELAAAGAHIVVAARGIEAGEAVAAGIVASGGSARAAVMDVSDYGRVDTIAREIARREGRIDIIVNNAGVVGPLSTIAESDPEAWARTIAINLTGVYNVCRAMLGLMAPGGVVVNVGSGAADGPVPAMSAYCASKAALSLFNRSLAMECAASGIAVIGFRPGRTDTDMHGELRAARANSLGDLDRDTLASPESRARAILRLCGEEARSFSGRELDMDALAAAFAPR